MDPLIAGILYSIVAFICMRPLEDGLNRQWVPLMWLVILVCALIVRERMKEIEKKYK